MSRGTFRFWMVLNGVVLVALTAFVLQPALTGEAAPSVSRPSDRPTTPRFTTPPPADQVPTKQEIMADSRIRFGLSAPEVPWSAEELQKISTTAGARPTMLQYFVKWNEEVRADAIEASYQQRALPIISWEPWDGAEATVNQPKYALKRIAGGAHDTYITKVATTLRDARYPVGIRFAHEMNGNWYPWSESRSGNRKGDYVKAWRHVHDIFKTVGAENVLWIWSPNIIRAVPNVSLSALYPGDEYVDWAGTVGYAVRERAAGAVFEPTLKALAKVTDKPVLITETGVQPGPLKTGWIEDFFPWLAKQRNLVGFVWFEYSSTNGGNQDWRFSAKPENAKAFKTGLRSLNLATPPVPQ